MLLIDDILISDLVIETRFSCDLGSCRGVCCQLGERGSPLAEGEVEEIEEKLARLVPRLEEESKELIEQLGFYERSGKRRELRCLDNGRCVFARLPAPGAPLRCVIEESARELADDPFPKPLFCHLFPLRIDDFYGRKCLNLEIREECHCAVDRGKSVVDFCKRALSRSLGEERASKIIKAVNKERKLRQRAKAGR